jgi:hypothetical protein
MCSAWQMWQAVSGPLVWWWRIEPPAAKYNSATQPNTASARRPLPRPKLSVSEYIHLYLQCTSLDGRKKGLVARNDALKVIAPSRGLRAYNLSHLAASACLTPQPFPPKLRLTKYMSCNIWRLHFLALLLGIVFLAAQFHLCADLTSDPATSHFCPLCSTAGSATMAALPGVAIAPAVDRLETVAQPENTPAALPHVTSPRAPPYC